MRTFDELISLQNRIDRLHSELDKALAEESALLDKLRPLLADLKAAMQRGNQAAVRLQACQNAERDLPPARRAVQDAQDQLDRLNKQASALEAVIAAAPTGLPVPGDVAALLGAMSAIYPDLPAEVRADLDLLQQKVQSGGIFVLTEWLVLLAKWKQLLSGLRSQIAYTGQELDQASQRLAGDEQLAAQQSAAVSKLAAIQADIDAKTPLVNGLQDKLKSVQERIRTVQEELSRDGAQLQDELDGLLSRPKAEIPLVLLPVRLETRYLPGASGSWELSIRIYPDNIAQDGFLRQLSAEEQQRGTLFWQQIDKAGSQDERKVAWNRLVERFGPGRAAWIADQMGPGPTSGRTVKGRTELHAFAQGLPDRFVALGYTRDAGGNLTRSFTHWGRLIRQPLVSTLLTSKIDEMNWKSGIDPDALWMVDFQAAEKAGMAIRVPLEAGAPQRFDQLIVLGVRAMISAEESAQGLRELLEAHHYSWGLGFLGQGTPTNNTAEAASGLQREDPGSLNAYNNEMKGHPVPARAAVGRDFALSASDGSRVGDALGLSVDGQPGEERYAVLEHIGRADRYEQRSAADMNRALWPATAGYFLRQIMAGQYSGKDDLNFPVNFDLEAWRQYFVRYVRGRGPLPLLRVGHQPYGLLPVTSLDAWQPGQRGAQKDCDLAVFTAQEVPATGQLPGKLRLVWDVGEQNQSAQWDQPGGVPGMDDATPLGGGLALVDVRREGRRDLVCLRINQHTGASPAQLVVGRNLHPSGRVDSWSQPFILPAPLQGNCQGAGLAVADFNHDGKPDAAVVRFEQIGGFTSGYYQIGFGLDARGHIETVSQPFYFLDSPDSILAASATAADVDADENAEIVLFKITRGRKDTAAYVQILWTNEDGSLRNAGPSIRQDELEALLWRYNRGRVRGAGLAVDVINTGTCDLLLCVGLEYAPGEPPAAFFVRGTGLDAGGNVGGWKQLGDRTPLTGAHAGEVDFVCGLAAGQVGRSPVTSLRKPEGFANTMVRLRDHYWQVALDSDTAPRVDGGGGLNENVLRLLAQTALPARFKLERLLSANGLAQAWARQSPGDPRADVNTYQQQAAQLPLLKEIGQATWNPRLQALVYLKEGGLSPYPTTLVGDDVSESEPLPQNSALRQFLQNAYMMTPEAIFQANEDSRGKPGIPLLLRLLYFSTLWAYVKAAELVLGDTVTEPEQVLDPDTQTPWRYLTKEHSRLNGKTPAEVLCQRVVPAGVAVDLNPAFAYLDEYFAGLQRLMKLPGAELERLLVETLDLFANRLDAWITSVATQRLDELRARTPVGVYLGSYGWVENLVPRSASTLPSGGYIHAPSPAQAFAAAILRSGYLSHDENGTGSRLAVNLSSRRVRRALELVDGLRQGLSLGQMLGYRLERTMRDSSGYSLAKYILALRGAFPLVANKLTTIMPGQGPLEAVAANNVVDGLKLLGEYQQSGIKFLKNYCSDPRIDELVQSQNGELENLTKILDDMQDASDALSDLGVAEAIFQAAQGNHTRSAAGLDALSAGEVPMEKPWVVQTPRTGQAAAHRLMVLFSTNGGVATGGFASQGWVKGPRSQAEPLLNEFAARLLGDPRRVTCQTAFIDPHTGKEIEGVPAMTITMDKLGLCPLDVIYSLPVGSEAGQSELEQRLAYYALVTARPAGLNAKVEAAVRLTFAPDSTWPVGALGFPEILEAARVGREVITSARALRAEDLLHPQAITRNLVVTKEAADEMERRAKLGVEGLNDAISTLERLLNQPWAQGESSDLSDLARRKALGDALQTLIGFDLQAALPVQAASPNSRDWPALLLQCREAVKLSRERQKKMPPEPGANSTDAERWDAHTKRLQAVFGEGFRVAPVFAVQSAVPEDDWTGMLGKAVQGSPKQGAEPAAVYAWFLREARVRAGAARLADLLLYQEAMCPEAARQGSFVVAQMPYTDGTQGWAGLTAAEGQTAIAVFAPQPLNLSQPLLAGLLLDNWVEVVPNKKETTAVTFHYDAPGATSPQAALLVVSPDPTCPWDLSTLEAVLSETLNLARLRAVRLYDVAGVGHYLPALYLAQNTAQDTISFRE